MSAHFSIRRWHRCRFRPTPLRSQVPNIGFSPNGISVPIQNPFNPFTVGDTTLVINGTPIPMTTGVSFRGINDTGPRHEKITYQDSLFDVGLRGEMGEFGDYFKTWNWELGFRYSRNDGQDLAIGEASQPGLREALLDTNPATAFDPFLNFNAHNTKAARQRVYVTLHNSGEYELPIGYATVNGDLLKLPAGPISFAIGGEYDAPRWTRDRDSLNTTFQSIGSADGGSARVNRDVWSIYQEVRVPFTSDLGTSPDSTASRWTLPSARNGTARTPLLFCLLELSHFSRRPTASIMRRSQRSRFAGSRLIPNISAALTLRGSYTEAFHAPALSEISPASTQDFSGTFDPFTKEPNLFEVPL